MTRTRDLPVTGGKTLPLAPGPSFIPLYLYVCFFIDILAGELTVNTEKKLCQDRHEKKKMAVDRQKHMLAAINMRVTLLC